MEYRKLSDIASLIGGYAFKSSDYVNEGLRVIRIANVQDGYICDDYPCFYPISLKSKIGEAVLIENDLLMSLTGNVGRVALLSKEMLPAVLNQRVECIRPNDLRIKKYLYWFFRSDKFKKDAEKNSSGIAQLNMSTKWLNDYSIPYVSIEKQQEIVATLDKINVIIEDDKKQIELLDETIKSRFIEMFGTYQANKTIGDLASICRGASPRPISNFITNNDDGENWIKIGDVGENDIFITHTKEKVTKMGADKSRRVKPGDFILSNSMSFGRPYILGINGCVHDGWLIISDYQNTFEPLFFYQLLRSDDVQTQFDGSANGACVRNLNSDLVKKVKVMTPPKELQKEFVDFFIQIDKSKFNIQQHIMLMQEFLDKKMNEYFN